MNIIQDPSIRSMVVPAEMPPIFFRRHSGNFLKNAIKIHFVFIAVVESYFLDRFVGFDEHSGRCANSFLQDVLLGGNTQMFFPESRRQRGGV